MKKNKYHQIKRFLLAGVVLICLCFTFLFFSIRDGVHIDHLSFSNFVIKDCNIYWDNGGHIDIDQFLVEGASISFPIPYGEIFTISQQVISLFQYVEPVISTIKIREFTTSNLTAGVDYISTSNKNLKHIRFHSPIVSVETKISITEGGLKASNLSLKSEKFNVDLSGSADVNFKNSKVEGELAGTITKNLPITISVSSNKRGVFFSGKSLEPFTQIKSVIDIFNLDPDITPWVSDYLKGESYFLEMMKGFLSWDDPMSLLTSLNAKAVAINAEYTFAEGFQPVKSKKTEVIFEDSILKIYPEDAQFYGQNCGKTSWLDISFKDPVFPILTVYLKTRAALNQDLLDLIKYYDLEIPVKQETGQTDADLTLSVNLKTEDVEAKGVFKVGPGIIEYMNMDLDVLGGVVRITNSHVGMNNFTFSLNDLLTAKFNGHIDAANAKGLLTFDVDKVTYNLHETPLELYSAEVPLKVEYIIQPQGDLIKVADSEWTFKNKKYQLTSFAAPFDYKKLYLTIPPVSLKDRKNRLKIIASGNVDIDNFLANFALELKKLDLNNIKLNQPGAKLTAAYTKEWRIESPEYMKFMLSGSHFVLDPFNFNISDEYLTIEKGGWTIGDYLSGEIDGVFNTTSLEGTFALKNFNVNHPTLGSFFKSNRRLKVEFGRAKRDFYLRIPELETFFQVSPNSSWSLIVRNLEPYLEFSSILERLNFSSGDLHVTSESGGMPLQMEGRFFSPYTFIIEEGLDQDLYVLKASFGDKGFEGIVNDSISINYKDHLEFRSTGVEYNIQEIASFIQDFLPDEIKAEDGDFSLKFFAEDTALHFQDGNIALADSLYIKAEGENALFQLKHGAGIAWLSKIDEDLYFSGEGFEDTFVEGLIRESRFSGGTLSFSGAGTLEDLEAQFQIDDTVLVNFGLVNNIFAFVDTIPALFTFSLPNYRAKGMGVSSAVLKFRYRDEIFNIETFAIKSSNLNMFGAGEVNLVDETINMDINLTTTAKENISKIPLVGYVLVGDERQPSITLKVTGKPEDPDVATSAFKDYLAWPVKTVYRAIKLPFGILDKIFTTTGGDFESSLPVIAPSEEANSE